MLKEQGMVKVSMLVVKFIGEFNILLGWLELYDEDVLIEGGVMLELLKYIESWMVDDWDMVEDYLLMFIQKYLKWCIYLQYEY